MNRIIVVNFGGVGDLVLSIPFLRGLKASFPSSQVSVLCAERSGRILKDQPYIDTLYLSPVSALSLLKVSLRLRKKRFDIAVNLMPHTSLRSAINMYLLFSLINAKVWAGRDTGGRGFFYDIKASEEKMQMEGEVLLHSMLLKAIVGDLYRSGGDFDETLKFHIPESRRDEAEEIISRERRFHVGDSFRKRPLVLINPGSDWPSRRWHIERYGELLSKLIEFFPSLEFGIIGTKEEAGLANYLLEATRTDKKIGKEMLFILSGKTSLEILPAILTKASLLITNDSGPAHLARAVGTPVVVLVGPSHPAFLRVKGSAETLLIYHPVSCTPCLKVSCDKMDCWKAISVEEVFEVTSGILKRVIYGADSKDCQLS